MPNVERVSVIGAGTMGAGIAQVFAQSGIGVTLIDIDDSLLDRALAGIDKSLSRLVKKEKMTDDQKAEALAKIKKASTTSDAAGSDLVVEAINENADLKKKVWGEVATVVSNDYNTRVEHVVDFDHRTSRRRAQSKPVYRNAFHEPRSDHETRRGHPRAGDRTTRPPRRHSRPARNSARYPSRSTITPGLSPTGSSCR